MFLKQKILLGLFLTVFAFPFLVEADVIINEVGWLGTVESSYNEWIELYNSGNEEIDLANWALYERDESGADVQIIKLTQKIAPQDYYLVVRVTASAPNPFPEAEEAGTFKGGGILNTGENLVLKDLNGQEVDSVLALGQWRSSDRDGRTMQKNDANWIMAMGTPGASNATEAISEGDGENDDNDNSGSGSSNDSNLSAHSGQVEISDYDPDDVEISAGRARLTNVMTPIEFKVESKSTLAGIFEWSFGDGESKRGAKVSHKYDFPGQYNVVLNYYAGNDEAVSRTTVTVTEPNFDLVVSPAEKFLAIKNLGDREENINDWTVKNGSSTVFTFAKDTIIGAGSELKISLSKEITTKSWSLNCADGSVVAEVKTEISSGKLDKPILSASTTAKVSELRQELVKAEMMLLRIQKERALSLAAVGSAGLTKPKPSDQQKIESLTSANLSPNSTDSDIIIIEREAGVVTKILKAFKEFF